MLGPLERMDLLRSTMRIVLPFKRRSNSVDCLGSRLRRGRRHLPNSLCMIWCTLMSARSHSICEAYLSWSETRRLSLTPIQSLSSFCCLVSHVRLVAEVRFIPKALWARSCQHPTGRPFESSCQMSGCGAGVNLPAYATSY